MTNRDNLLDKIRALMSKTTANGCTEHEAFAALDKARAMMDAYEISDEELQLTKAEKAIFSRDPDKRDPHHIKQGIGNAVAHFCDCKVWRGADGLVFCGLPSDAQFATWLLDNLASFVAAELVGHLMGNVADRSTRTRAINGFVFGAGNRISERLRALCASSAVVATSNGRALVVTKTAAVAEKMAAEGIRLGKARRSSRRSDAGSYAAGRSAGDRANFGRPVSGDGATMRIGRA